MKHTPGPWKAVPTHRRTSKVDWLDVVSEQGYSVCKYVSPEDGVLIAAAPELLEACKKANYWLLKASECWAIDDEVFDFIQAAIAKAEGHA